MSAELNKMQRRVVARYIMGLMRRRCLCYVRTHGTQCTRCEALADAREAFPVLFTKAAEAVALSGPEEKNYES